jgi:hypothetical protein
VLNLVTWFLVRILQALAGFFLFYGIEGMLSSRGLQPPNILVPAALLVIGLLGAAAWRSDRRPVGGLWVAGLVVGLPLLLQSARPTSAPVCPPDHPPLTETYNCVPPGAPVVLAISSVGLLLSFGGAVIELRGLIVGPATAARSN